MAGLYPPALLEQVRASSDIVEIIGGYVPLKRAGANFVALCPFHKEKSPSFNVNPQRQIFHCFGCHKGGDVFTFVKEYENIGFAEAVRRLAERAHITLETDETPGARQNRFVKETLLQIHEQITQRWQAALQNDAAGQVARDYLLRRGVPAEAVSLFRLGYAPDAWDDTVNWAKSKHFELPLVEQAGLIIRKEGSDRHYDRFRGRLIFPICDEQGRVIGFSGRILTGDEKTAKYVNSPETPIFTKGRVFFGLDKSKLAILDAHTAIVCEGQLDLIACHMAGIRNIVAPQGTALTPDHARMLKRYADEVILCFDSDNAGQKAAVRSLDSLLAAGLAIRVAVVPAPHDPDSYLKEFGAESFRGVLGQATGFFDFYLDRLSAENDLNSDKGRLAVARAMAEAVQKSGSAVLLDKYAQKTAIRLGVAADTMRKEFRRSGSPVSREPADSLGAEAEEEMPGVIEPPPQLEGWLLRLMLANDELVEWLQARLDMDWITHPGVREILTLRLHAHAAQQWHGPAAFLAELGDSPLASLVSAALAETRTVGNSEELLRGGPGKTGLLERMRERFVTQQLRMLTQRMAQPDLPEEEQRAIIMRQAELRDLKRLPLA